MNAFPSDSKITPLESVNTYSYENTKRELSLLSTLITDEHSEYISYNDKESILICSSGIKNHETLINQRHNTFDNKNTEKSHNIISFTHLSNLEKLNSQALENRYRILESFGTDVLSETKEDKVSKIEAYMEANICTITKIFSWIIAAINPTQHF